MCKNKLILFKIFCDFDNTITDRDTVDNILQVFTDNKWLEIEKLYEKGLLTAKDCLYQQISLLKVTEKDLKNYIEKHIRITKGFVQFVEMCNQLGYKLTIVSDGLDFIIKTILNTYNITNVTYYSNLLLKKQDDFTVKFPFYQKNCKYKLGCCKCAIVNKYKGKSKLIFIGDGTSDYCVAMFAADIIFAKDKLIDFCSKNNIAHYVFNDFYDIKKKIKLLINSEK